MGMREDSDKIDIVVVDCFNDVTGVNKDFTLMLDVQSKNYSTFNPARIGESLYTLFDNFLSVFHFHDYVLFSKPLDPNYLVDSSLHSFSYDNIKPKTKERIEKKLRYTIIKKHETLDDVQFEEFLKQVKFYNGDQPSSHYIKELSKFKTKRLIKDSSYDNIFNEIRDKQSSLKNSEIENEVISTPSEVLRLNRYITKNQIHSLIISRIIGVNDIFKEKGIPFSFLEVVTTESLGMDKDILKDTIQECNSNLSRTLFDKGTSKKFWQLSEVIIKLVKHSNSHHIYELYDKLHFQVKNMPPHMDRVSTLYLISLILQGIEL